MKRGEDMTIIDAIRGCDKRLNRLKREFESGDHPGKECELINEVIMFLGKITPTAKNQNDKEIIDKLDQVKYKAWNLYEEYGGLTNAPNNPHEGC